MSLDRPVFSPERERALTAVLDEVIPPDADRGLPGAGELGLVATIANAIRQAPDLAPAVEQGLAALEEQAGSRGGQAFADLSPTERRKLLNGIATTQPAFLPGLIFHGYTGYYQHPRVVEALGLEPRPPHPKGYEIEPTDWSLLDPVRKRPSLYREP